MTTPHGSRLPRFIRVAAALTVLAACSDQASNTITSPDLATPPVNLLVLTPPASQVVIPSLPFGTFSAYTANANGRATSQFFSNVSADEATATPQCNVGFYAYNQWTAANCLSFAGKTPTERFTHYWNDGSKPAAFRFSGQFTYRIKLKATVHGRESESVGWFEVTNLGAYIFHSLPEDTSVTTTIATDGRPWGFYITNDINGEAGGCDSPNTDCSDATGGYAGTPFQQFALFKNRGETRYLVGVEDNGINPITGNRDADYQDYIFSVEPASICDYVTFSRVSADVAGNRVSLSGNAGGLNRDGSVQGEFHVVVNRTDYWVTDIYSYNTITTGALAGLPDARIITGRARNGSWVELRVYDGGSPGASRDKFYVKIDGGAEYVGSGGATISQGEIYYSERCRGYCGS